MTMVGPVGECLVSVRGQLLGLRLSRRETKECGVLPEQNKAGIKRVGWRSSFPGHPSPASSPRGSTLMTSVIISRKYGGGNLYPLLPKIIKFSYDVLCEPCDHASVKTLLRRRLQAVDQLQQVTTSTPLVVMEF